MISDLISHDECVLFVLHTDVYNLVSKISKSLQRFMQHNHAKLVIYILVINVFEI